MANIAKLANGTLLKREATTGSFTTVPGCRRLRGPATRFDLLDVSDHDTIGLYKEFLPGMADGDQVQGEFNWRPSNSMHVLVRQDADSGLLKNYQMVFPDSSQNTVAMSVFVQRMEPEANVGEQLKSTMGLKITGAPAWS